MGALGQCLVGLVDVSSWVGVSLSVLLGQDVRQYVGWLEAQCRISWWFSQCVHYYVG